MRVEAIVSVYHGVTKQLTCPQGAIYEVERTHLNPQCPDFIAAGLTPAAGIWYEFKNWPGTLHTSTCFREVSVTINKEFKFFKKKHE